MKTIGTSLVALKIKDERNPGVVLGTDMGTTVSIPDKSTGELKEFVTYNTIKTFKFAERIYGCATGDRDNANFVAHCVHRSLKTRAEHDFPVTVWSVASLVSWILFQHKDGLGCDFIVGGWDSTRGAQIYRVSEKGGMSGDETFAATGFGEELMLSALQSKELPQIREGAEQFARDVLKEAIDEFSGAGGPTYVVAVTEKAVNKTIVLEDGRSVDQWSWK